MLGEPPSTESAVQAAVWIVELCRREPTRAAVLQAGRRAFEPGSWPAADSAADTDAERVGDRGLAAACQALAADTGAARGR